MPLSQTALQGVLAEATSEVFLECLTISHSQFSTLRLVNNTQEIVRAAGTYSPFPFSVSASSGSGDRPPALDITIDMVDQRVMQAVRATAGLREVMQITYDVILAGSPNTIEFGPAVFNYDGVSTDGLTQLTLRASYLKGALNDAFPALQFAPSNVRGT